MRLKRLFTARHLLLTPVLATFFLAAQNAQGERSVRASGTRIRSILGASGEVHSMHGLAKSGEFVNEDLEQITLDESPCVLMARAQTALTDQTPGPGYAVYVECFDLIPGVERRRLLYMTDAKGEQLPDGTVHEDAFRQGEAGFDSFAFEWLIHKVTPEMRRSMADARQKVDIATWPLDPLEHLSKPGGDTKPPQVIWSTDAAFSERGRKQRINGKSVVALMVDTDGLPKRVHTTTPLGFGMDEEAIRAVRQYRFTPATLRSKPIAVRISVEVNFRIY